MIRIENEKVFGKVIADAISAVENNGAITSGDKIRWFNAINKGVQKLGERGEFFNWMTDAQHLLIWSDSNGIYEANGTCQCPAFVEFHHPCWHRALAKLIKNYLAAETSAVVESESDDWHYLNEVLEAETENTPTPAAKGGIHSFDNAPYLKPTLRGNLTKVGNFRI
jgi:hypothetical protein